jgi:hypothetical protein
VGALSPERCPLPVRCTRQSMRCRCLPACLCAWHGPLQGARGTAGEPVRGHRAAQAAQRRGQAQERLQGAARGTQAGAAGVRAPPPWSDHGVGGGGAPHAATEKWKREPLSRRASQHTRMRRELRSQFCVRGAAVAAGRCASVCAQVEAGAPLADLVFCLGPAARAEEGLQEKIEKLGGITKARCDQWQCRC